jgi:hypothetical protein
VLIALLIQGLTALTLLVGYHAYRAGLAAVGRPGLPALWLLRPGELALGLLIGVAGGGWLTGVWLGERLRERWPAAGLLMALIAVPIALWIDGQVGATPLGERLIIVGLAPVSLLLGGLAGAWWSGLGPEDEADAA